VVGFVAAEPAGSAAAGVLGELQSSAVEHFEYIEVELQGILCIESEEELAAGTLVVEAGIL
jgi:hypothetical protein